MEWSVFCLFKRRAIKLTEVIGGGVSFLSTSDRIFLQVSSFNLKLHLQTNLQRALDTPREPGDTFNEGKR
jgi:hypothetical protein